MSAKFETAATYRINGTTWSIIKRTPCYITFEDSEGNTMMKLIRDEDGSEYVLIEGTRVEAVEEFGHGENITLTVISGGLTEYDEQGRIIKKTLRNNESYYYEYDKNGNLTKEAFPNGHHVSYEHDEQGRVIKETRPSGIFYCYEYDKNGNIFKRTASNGRVYYY